MSYLQLAHNEWDPAAKTARTKVLFSFGRADQLDRAAVERLIGALTRLVGTEPAASVNTMRVSNRSGGMTSNC